MLILNGMIKEKYSVSLFAIWFALILTAISSTFLYLLLNGTPTNFLTLILLITLTTGLIALAIFCWLITFTFLFGKKNIRNQKPEFILTTLWKMEMMRENFGYFHNVVSNPYPEIQSEIAWSWIAFDNRQGSSPTGAIGVVEAAVWNLVALKYVEMKIRNETITYFFNCFSKGSEKRLYFTLTDNNQDIPLGLWEKKLLLALRNFPHKDKGIKTFDWIIMAFGNSCANSMRQTLEFTEEEFIEKHWGHRSGIFLKEFHWEIDPTRVSSWPIMRSYIKSHDLENHKIESTLKKEIELALENRNDA